MIHFSSSNHHRVSEEFWRFPLFDFLRLEFRWFVLVRIHCWPNQSNKMKAFCCCFWYENIYKHKSLEQRKKNDFSKTCRTHSSKFCRYDVWDANAPLPTVSSIHPKRNDYELWCELRVYAPTPLTHDDFNLLVSVTVTDECIAPNNDKFNSFALAANSRGYRDVMACALTFSFIHLFLSGCRNSRPALFEIIKIFRKEEIQSTTITPPSPSPSSSECTVEHFNSNQTSKQFIIYLRSIKCVRSAVQRTHSNSMGMEWLVLTRAPQLVLHKSMFNEFWWLIKKMWVLAVCQAEL